MSGNSSQPVRVRIAPSPTGPLHFGTARTALFNVLFARKNKGVFIIRIEDTDKERSEKRYEQEILEGLAWLGLTADEGPTFEGADHGSYGPYRQSERTELYKKFLKQLLDGGHAYYCYCTKEDLEAQRQAMLSAGLAPKYSGHCRNLKEPPAGKKAEVIRFKVPEVHVEFKDLVRGKVSFDAALLGDQVIAKDLDTPLYNFAVVVDDELMKISHVIRGEDHLSNTPKQILVARALGFREPIYAHIPLILNPDRSKMSKRFADTTLSEYRKKGYLPEGMVNFMALLGWHPEGNQEIFSLDELAQAFDIDRVQASGAIFNEEKLGWINREHMKRKTDDELVVMLKPFVEEMGLSAPDDMLKKIIDVERPRANTLSDILTSGSFFFKLPEYDASLLSWKQAPPSKVADVLRDVLGTMGTIAAGDFHKELLNEHLAAVIARVGSRGEVLWPLRVALSGQSASPDPLEIMEVVGKEESIARITAALKKLENNK